MRKIFLFLFFVVLISSTVLADRYSWSIRSLDKDVKVNVNSNGERGQGSVEYSIGDYECRLKLKQTEILYGVFFKYDVQYVIRNYETRDVYRGEIESYAYFDGDTFCILDVCVAVSCKGTAC